MLRPAWQIGAIPRGQQSVGDGSAPGCANLTALKRAREFLAAEEARPLYLHAIRLGGRARLNRQRTVPHHLGAPERPGLGRHIGRGFDGNIRLFSNLARDRVIRGFTGLDVSCDERYEAGLPQGVMGEQHAPVVVLNEDDDRGVLAWVFEPIAPLAARRPSAVLQGNRRAATSAVTIVRVPARQRHGGQRQGRVVAPELPTNRAQMLPAAPGLVPAGLDRDDAASTRHPDERGRGSLEIARGLFPGQASQSRRIRGPHPGLVEEDESGGINDDNIRLTRGDQVTRRRGFTQRHRRIDVTANERKVNAHISTVSRWTTLGTMTTNSLRADGRTPSQLRPVSITRGWAGTGEGSVLIEFGNTRVLCVASFTEGVPRWKRDSGEGWVTGEYSMLPRATEQRSSRESVKGKVGGRTQEISRLIGRSLRGIVDVSALGENTIVLDCDVLRADGGTRTAAITGAYVALADAVAWAKERGILKPSATVLTDSISAISVGVIDGTPMLDLPYVEDVRAQTDMNVVQTGDGRFIEVQGTAEHAPFDRDELNELLDLATLGNAQLARAQKLALEAPLMERIEVRP